jgi:flagellar hook-associated protein 3 FlgL
MRVATAHSYDSTIKTLTQRQAEIEAQQSRISTGKRVQRASDDPVAAALAETVANRIARVTADQRAIESSRTSLTQAESALGEAGDLIQKVRDLVIGGGNATYGASERADLAQQIEGLREQMFSVANRKDSAGRTLFGGLGGASTPFVDIYGPANAGVRFDGQRGQQAAGDVTLPQALDGDQIWMSVPQGNGSFTLALPATNTGSMRSDTGHVSNPTNLTGHDYSVSFAGAPGAMLYSVTDTTTGLPVPGQSGVPYVSGTTVEFDGMSFKLSGQPAAGDSVEVAPPTGQTDLFQVMQDAVDALRASDTASGDAARRTQRLDRALGELDAGHDRVLQARARAGEWLNRADSLDNLLGARSVDYEDEKSSLVDLDMIQGISESQKMQTGLDAALKSYAQVQRLSLFNYVG